MKVILKDGTELVLLNASGEPVTVQGETRDSLALTIPASAGLETVNTAFTEENCESIRLVEESGTEHVHTGYVLRTALTLTPGVEGGEGQITVTMAKRNYAEEQLLAIRRQTEETAARMTDTQLALCEVYEMMVGTGEEVGVDG